ncbi:13994_t:CDS:2 [Funneliformis geosporum]|nr:13994_t:CDS:2 [Funneliformis geosporum]
MTWDNWENFVAQFDKAESVLVIRVQLNRLEICDTQNQFSRTGLPKKRSDNKIIDMDGFVFINEKWHINSDKITTSIINEQFKAEDINELSDDTLIITRDNFEQYFGPVLASRLAFSIMGELNINTATSQRISNLIHWVRSIASTELCKKRPYYDVDDLIEKNERYKNQLKRPNQGWKSVHSHHIASLKLSNLNN